MKIGLKSDFLDYYDHWFDGRGSPIIFERMSTGGMTRPEMFDFFIHYGIRTPSHGRVCDLPQKGYCVVYQNNRSHRGEGKCRLSIAEAMAKYSNYFASEFIGCRGESFRYLSVGDQFYWLKYKSADDWRSNFGDVDIAVLPAANWICQYHYSFGLPLYAIDFVRADDNLYAIDFNIAPQIRGTGIEDILSGEDVAEQIKKYVESAKNDHR